MLYQMATRGVMREVDVAEVSRVVNEMVLQNVGAKQNWSRDDEEVQVTVRDGRSTQHLLYARKSH
jgi:hypothetical protein